MVEQQRPHQVGAAYLEPLAALGGGRQTDVVQHRAEVEHLVVEPHAVSGSERSCELIAALAVRGDDRRALVEETPHLGRQRRVRWIDDVHAVTVDGRWRDPAQTRETSPPLTTYREGGGLPQTAQSC